MKPFWITFYSYKGGVGRSLALANIAALMVKSGRRVLMIDFDLEAPGLDSFSEFAKTSGKAGVVEYVSEFLRNKIAPDVRDYVHECELPGPQRGQLWLMPAGKKDRAYSGQLNKLNWSQLYESGVGGLFFENWKADINQKFRPDVVLVDSRTGLTEIGGVCTTQLPDLVVMLFGLNSQNIKGTAVVADAIRESQAGRIPPILFVASPVPNVAPIAGRSSKRSGSGSGARNQVTERLDAAFEALGTKKVLSLHYLVSAALSEKLFVLDGQMAGQGLISDYYELHEEIIDFNRMGLDFLLMQAEEALTDTDPVKAERIVRVLDREYGDRSEALMIKARLALLNGDRSLALRLAESAFELDVSSQEAFAFLQNQYTRDGDLERRELLYSRILTNRRRIHADRHAEIYNDYGELLMCMCRYEDAEKAYRINAKIEQVDKQLPALALISKFNIAESHRRAANEIYSEEWAEVLDLFQQSGAASDEPLNVQANQWQAIHIAFACVGDLSGAFQSLKRAQKAAEAVGEIEEIFCAAVYSKVAAAQFLEFNKKMMSALSQKKMWDGMSLKSVAHS